MNDHSTLPWVVKTFADGGWHCLLIRDVAQIPQGANFIVVATNVEEGWVVAGKGEAYQLDEHYKATGEKK